MSSMPTCSYGPLESVVAQLIKRSASLVLFLCRRIDESLRERWREVEGDVGRDVERGERDMRKRDVRERCERDVERGKRDHEEVGERREVRDSERRNIPGDTARAIASATNL